MAFGEHLCADKHIQLACAEFKYGALEKFAARGRVAVQACDAKRWKTLAQHLFNLLCPFANVVNKFVLTRRAVRWCSAAMIAIVTDDAHLAAMIGQCHVAVGAVD